METTLIKVIDFCQSRKVETTFLQTMEEYGLIHIIIQQEEQFIDEDELKKLERFSNLYYDLEVNPQGIQVANHLLDKVEQLQHEVLQLKNKLKSLDY
ncbi:chaperone modulator CbpM [Sphingobacterium detergens]|uniref:MerR-like DNA binding protein n=1 Tax=Sphingobacterium detergens TaxID=1145106 RepID=A0A420AJI2_SPHD1|nr:chaperone modulator CbpM [Sphingobacterium detergens]RKE44502.1 MerR-like DNA binding protein [Sphingobacterium detergens]